MCRRAAGRRCAAAMLPAPAFAGALSSLGQAAVQKLEESLIGRAARPPEPCLSCHTRKLSSSVMHAALNGPASRSAPRCTPCVTCALPVVDHGASVDITALLPAARHSSFRAFPRPPHYSLRRSNTTALAVLPPLSVCTSVHHSSDSPPDPFHPGLVWCLSDRPRFEFPAPLLLAPPQQELARRFAVLGLLPPQPYEEP